ncbi:MAG: acyltransferase family protein [Methanobacteriaceae archaeon]|jgi:fucose 4-O-acetylase-like acetyltransferase|nr:acyltransferase family protein [Methanobacteriaceae archaeon]MDO9627236.1 acyltransferase family protein [Methanobacteriaceae archaeon]
MRDLKLDNLKGLAMVLIVFGHFFEQTILMDFQIPYFIYICRCALAMPIFVFVSGYLSKTASDSGTKAFRNIFMPYLLFSTLWIIFSFLKDGNLSLENYFFPAAGLWYLLCLFYWRTFLPALDKFKYPILLSIIPVLYLGTLNINFDFLAISRAISFLPIFLFGFYFKEIKEKIKIKNIYVAVIGFIVSLSIFAFAIQNHGAIMSFKRSYSELGLSDPKGILLTLFVLIASMVVLTLLYSFMTSNKTFLTKIGKNSLVVYVFHFYIFLSMPQILTNLGLNFILNNTYYSILYAVLLPSLVLYILSRDVLTEWTNKLIFVFTKFITKNPDKNKISD